VQWTTVNLVQPEQETTDVGFAPQKTKLSRRDECAIIFAVDEGAVVNWI
jgi:hypothetical protein